MREVAESPRGDAPMGFTVVRVPFFLEPDYPEGPEFEETNRVRLIRKWGGQAGWEAQKARHDLKGRGRAVGIEHFNLDRVASNTVASHRLVQWVTKTLGVNAAESLYAELNEKHFEGGIKLNDKEMLAAAAERAGADLEEAKAFLADDSAGRPEIEAAQDMLRRMGVSGIPTLVLGGKYRLPSGALHSDDLVHAFRTIEAEGGATGSAFADALNIPDEVMQETIRL
mmetsp:Transcript_22780/g.68381  ORF Transcript_22780/g.68381 Transcript_22780/m.68381 type:complete len:226 (+) Transcript_22780:371-1048(+)